VIAGTILVALGLIFRPGGHEPGPAGKPLSYWTEHLSGTEFGRSYDAIRAIGANGVPWLLGRVRSAHGLQQRGYAAVWPRLPMGLRKRLPAPLNVKAVEEKVTYALGLLESNGVPSLVAAFQDRQSSVRRVTVLAIGRMLLTDRIVAQSVPGLSKLLADPDESVRLAVISTLEKMGARAKAAMPALVQAIREPKPEASRVSGLGFRALAARLLGLLGPEAKPAAPELRKLLAAPERDLRSEAAIALWRINRETNMLAVLTAELEQRGLMAYPDVLTALGEMGPLAKAAVPAIIKMLGPPQAGFFSQPDSTFTLNALEKIDRQAADRVRHQAENSRQTVFIRQVIAEMAARSNSIPESSRKASSVSKGTK
jgi:HEAT repeats